MAESPAVLDHPSSLTPTGEKQLADSLLAPASTISGLRREQLLKGRTDGSSGTTDSLFF
jgi:hypothetical protein